MPKTCDNTHREEPIAVAIDSLESDMLDAVATGDSPTVQRLTPMITSLTKSWVAILERRNILLHIDDVIAITREFVAELSEVIWELCPDDKANEIVERFTEIMRTFEKNLVDAIEDE